MSIVNVSGSGDFGIGGVVGFEVVFYSYVILFSFDFIVMDRASIF